MLTIYALDLSSPALKVLYVANALGLKYEKKGVNLGEGEGQKPEYLAIHPAGKVPAIVDGDFKLFESNAIIKYLARTKKSDLYPEDPKQQAVIDQWIDFVSLHIQNGVGRVLWNKIFAPKLGKEVDENSMKCGYEFLSRYLPIVNQQLGKSKYLAGEKLSLADFTLLAHIDPLEAIEVDINQYPNVVKWRESLRTKDFYQKVHKFYGEAMMAKQ
ncbi:MAG: glutathione S-transferase family protein [Candidatus Omnitrophota bacterium]